jgi:hypothetical protein
MKTFSEWLISEVGVAGVTAGVSTPTSAAVPTGAVTLTTTTQNPQIKKDIKIAVGKDLQDPKGLNLDKLVISKRKDIQGVLKDLASKGIIK